MAGADGIGKGLVLEEGGAVVRAGLQRHFIGVHEPMLGALGRHEADARAEHQLTGRNEHIESRLAANGGDLLLLLGAIGKHAQIQHCAHTVGEIHRGVAVVDDIGDALGVAFADMVYVHAA